MSTFLDNISKDLDKESIAFWGKEISDPSELHKSLMRYQILKQLKEQFNIDPFRWVYVYYSNEGWSHRTTNPNEKIDFSSGQIMDRTGAKLKPIVFWINFTTSSSDPEKDEPCDSPDKCNIKFFVDMFDGITYGSDGSLSENSK